MKQLAATSIKSTKELRKIFTELSLNDRFRQKLNEIFEAGYTFEVEVKKPFNCFKTKSGKQFKAAIRYNGKGRLFKATKLKVAYMPETMATKIGANIIPGKTMGYTIKDGVKYYDVLAKYEDMTKISWAVILKLVGQLIKDDLTVTASCPRCGGSGILPEFMYYADGICFECMGTGKWIELNK